MARKRKQGQTRVFKVLQVQIFKCQQSHFLFPINQKFHDLPTVCPRTILISGPPVEHHYVQKKIIHKLQNKVLLKIQHFYQTGGLKRSKEHS